MPPARRQPRIKGLADRGAQAEQRAAEFLEHHGLLLQQRNYRCRYGEIDLIMRDGPTLVFVEVRLRSHAGFGGPAVSIDSIKQGKLLRTAQHYLAALRQVPPCRFDAVLFHGDEGVAVEWIKNAFAG
jgi:putative endonuclease